MPKQLAAQPRPERQDLSEPTDETPEMEYFLVAEVFGDHTQDIEMKRGEFDELKRHLGRMRAPVFEIPPRPEIPSDAPPGTADSLDCHRESNLRDMGRDLRTAIKLFKEFPGLVLSGVLPPECLQALEDEGEEEEDDNVIYASDIIMDPKRMLAHAIEWAREKEAI